MANQTHTLTEFSSAIIATVGGLFVGGLLKLTNKLFDRRKDDLQEHLELRKELREELDAVKQELNQLQEQLDEWKQKYYAQIELTNLLKIDIIRLTDELSEYKQYSGMHQIVPPENLMD